MLGYYHEEKAKKLICAKENSPDMQPVSKSRTSSFMHDWSRHSILSQSRVPLFEKYTTVIHALGSTHEEYAV